MAETAEIQTKTLVVSVGDNELRLELPSKFSGGEETSATIEQIYGACQKISEGIPAALEWLAKKEEHIASINDRLKRRISRDEWGKKEDEVNGYIDACLQHETDYFKVAAAMAYLKYCFSLTLKDSKEALAMLADLKARGLLVQATDSGGIMVGYERCQLGDFGFEKEDEDEITRFVADFSRKLMALENQLRQAKTNEMKEQSDITMDELWDGKTGKCLIRVPPESYEDREGQTRWRSGGTLLIEATEKDIIPKSGGGKLEAVVRSMQEADVRLQRHTLKWDNPPGNYPKAFDQLMKEIMSRRDLTEEQAERYANTMRALWYLIIRGFKALDAEEKLDEVKEEFRKRASITPEQFFGLDGSENPSNGDACLEFEGAFRVDEKPSVYNLFFLARRSEADGRAVIEIVDMPPHVFDLLGPFANKQYSEGAEFKELPSQLRRVLRAIRGQRDLAAEIARA